jgi:hypothetical protein
MSDAILDLDRLDLRRAFVRKMKLCGGFGTSNVSSRRQIFRPQRMTAIEQDNG